LQRAKVTKHVSYHTFRHTSGPCRGVIAAARTRRKQVASRGVVACKTSGFSLRCGWG
jgi:hypothetical protein